MLISISCAETSAPAINASPITTVDNVNRSFICLCDWIPPIKLQAKIFHFNLPKKNKVLLLWFGEINCSFCMKQALLIVFGYLFVSTIAFAQDFSAFEAKQFVHRGDTLPYRILYPENYDPEGSYPVLFFLHGAGERGNDNEKQLTHGAKLFLDDSIRNA